MPASIANPNLATLLFYTCVTKEVKNQCNESFTLDQAESANAGFTANFTTIEQGHLVGMSSLFATHDVFFENGKGMRPDWEARWADASKKLAPLIEARKVVGFFLGDELLSGGKISVANLSTASSARARGRPRGARESQRASRSHLRRGEHKIGGIRTLTRVL